MRPQWEAKNKKMPCSACSFLKTHLLKQTALQLQCYDDDIMIIWYEAPAASNDYDTMSKVNDW